MRTNYFVGIIFFIFTMALTACGGGGDDDNGGGEPVAAPVITSFTADKSTLTAGSNTNINTVFTNGSGTIDNGVGSITSGTPVTVSPGTATTFTLSVTNSAGAVVTSSLTVNVIPGPVISSFAAEQNTISAGSSTNLKAVFADGSGSIDNAIGDVTSAVDVSVSPVITTTYTLTATNAAGTTNTATVTVSVIPVPVISAFIVDATLITAGTSTNLNPDFNNGVGVVDNGIGSVTSGATISVNPTSTTTYTLMVSNNTGVTVTDEVTVTVVPPPAITSFTTDISSIAVGESANLNAVFTGGSGSIDNTVGDVTSSTPVSVSPVSTTGYILTVTNAAGTAVTEMVTVNVINEAPVINGFNVSPSPTFTNGIATFSWQLNDANDDTLTCMLDADGNGFDDYIINDCTNTTSQNHTFNISDTYTARLTISDGTASPVSTSLVHRVLPSMSAAMSVNAPVVAGERLLFTLTVSNISDNLLGDVRVSTLVPDELSFTRFRDAEPNVTTGCISTCLPTDIAEWRLGTMVAGESRTIIVNALVAPGLPDGNVIALPVTFSAIGIANIQLNESVTVSNIIPADFALSTSTAQVTANETFTYKLDAGNVSVNALTTLQLRLNLPTDVSIVSISDGGMQVNPAEIVWDETDLAAGASLHREVTVMAGASLSSGQILQANAELTHAGGLAVDNTAGHTVTILELIPALKLDIGTTANPVVADKQVLYTLTLSNPSLMPIDSVSLLLRVPAELSFDRAQDTQPNALSGCVTTCAAGDEVVWDLGTLAAGASSTITINGLVDATVQSGDLITTAVRVSASNLQRTIDRQSTLVVFNTPAADLALSSSTDPVTVNESFTYKLDIGNPGTVALTTLQLHATLPPEVMIIAISDSGVQMGSGEVVWDVASLGAGTTLHREITVMANASAGGILNAHAKITHDGGLEVDNSFDHVVTVVGAALPLMLDIMSAANTVMAGNQVLYTLSLGNTSSSPLDNVKVLLRVPDELSFDRVNDAAPNVTPGCATTCVPGNEAQWNLTVLGPLAAGETRSITVNALVDAALTSGNLITTSVRVEVPGLGDIIDQLHTIAVSNTVP